MSAASLEQRLDELEVRMAFIDDTLSSLGDTLALHDRQLLALRNAVEGLRSELLAVRGTLTASPHDEPPPPHY
jgi:SlyX protein